MSDWNQRKWNGSIRWYGSGRNHPSWKARKAVKDKMYHARLQDMNKLKHPSVIMYEYLQKVKHENRPTEE